MMIKPYKLTSILHQSLLSATSNKELVEILQRGLPSNLSLPAKKEKEAEHTVGEPVAGPSVNDKARRQDAAFPQAAEVYKEEREVFLSKSERQLCVDFVQEILPGSEGDKIIKDEQIWKEQIFLHTTLITARTWNVYSGLLKKYEEGQSWTKQSGLSTKIRAINDTLDEVRRKFQEVSAIDVSPRMGVTLLARNVEINKDFLMTTVKVLCQLQSLVTDRKVINGLTRRISQQQDILNKRFHHRQDEEMPELHCKNNGTLTWEEAFLSLLELQNSGYQGYKKSVKMLSIDQAISLGMLLRDTAIVSLEELRYYLPQSFSHGKEVPFSVVNQLLICYPLLLVKKQKSHFLVNMHQMDFECEDLERLFSYDIRTKTEADESVLTAGEEKEKQKGRSGGRKPIEDKFPDIATIATEFIKANGFKAQERRRSTTFQSCGVTIKELRGYLLEAVPGLKEHSLGNTTVRYLFQPVKKGTFAAENYEGLIDGKVAHKDNTGRKMHINDHYLNSRIKLRKEFAAYLSEECSTVSCDSMNKLRVGTLAVSRYHQIRKIFLKEDEPQYQIMIYLWCTKLFQMES